MIVAELQKYLSDFNPDAKVEVVVKNYPKPFNLVYGSTEGCTKRTADNVSFMVDDINSEDAMKEDKFVLELVVSL